jgi:hypothetical protein
MRPRRLRRLLWLVALGAIVAAASLAIVVPKANAEPVSGCQVDLWGFLASQRRTICDGPLNPDGSWNRARIVWVPAHNVPFRTYCSGGVYYSSCSTSGGYFVPYSEVSSEVYPVNDTDGAPNNHLGDEPPHLVNGTLA